MHYKPTIDTPEVRFDDAMGVLEIKGRSLPEDAWSFYKPVIEWARGIDMNGARKLRVELFLEYFNSSSSRYLLELLATLESKARDRVNVVWFSENDDELMIEKGEEFSGLLSLPFEFRTV